MITYQVATSQSFWDSRDALQADQRGFVADAIEKVQKGLPGAHVHKLEGGLPYLSFYVNQGALRVICHREDDLLICLHVGAHDDAYTWARRHKIKQAGSFVRIVRSRVEESEEAGEVAAPKDDHPQGPLGSVPDDVFERFEIDAPSAGILRGVGDVDDLLDLMEHFPQARADAVLGLATATSDIDALEKAYIQALETPTEAPSLANAVRADINAGEFWIPHPEDESYVRALRGDFEAWRVFLHPTQRQVVKVDAKGAAKVTGGPGTGKTIVALHRARHLAERLDEDARLLLTTFSAVLTESLAEGVDRLCGADGSVRERIVVRSLVGCARDVLEAAGRPSALITDADVYWEKALVHDEAGLGRAFYETEREHVLAVHGCWDGEAYLRVRRTGRGTRLDRRGRKGVWKVLEAFEDALREAGGGDVIALCRDAAAALTAGETTSPYEAVICDEVQDVGASELRFLAALAKDPETGALRRNGLTLCGDGHQRIYRVPFSLKACGIDVRGRASRVLRLNYRTTEAIRKHAVAAIRGVDADELEDEGVDPLRGYRSLRRGEAPAERVFPTAEAEADWIAELAAEPKRLLVLARTRTWLQQLRRLLQARGQSPRLLGNHDRPGPEDRLLLTTLHRSKGLEAPRVVLAGRQLVPARYPGGGDEADKALWQRKERCLLYVGMTRARDWCGVSRVGRVP